MDFLTKEQKMIQSTAKEFSNKLIVPDSSEIDRTGQFPADILKKICEIDLMGILIPSDYGGLGLGALELVLAIEEIAAASASFGLSVVTSIHAGTSILIFGSNEQKKKYLPDLAEGKRLAAFACAEPNGGTNWPLTSMTTAKLDGDHYIINGSKCFITNAGVADVYIVMALTSPEKGPGGFSAFIIEQETEGFNLGSFEDKFGLRGCPTGELFFDSCRIPQSNLLGAVDGGMEVFQAGGGLHCVGGAAVFSGISQAALNSCIQYAKEREYIPSATLSQLTNVQGVISEIMAEVEAARLLNYKAAAAIQRPDPLPFLSFQFSSRVALKATAEAVALHGGYGCTQENVPNRLFRDAKTLSLQISYDSMKTMIGKMILGVQP